MTPTRKFPLYLDSLFSESAAFHLHLPPGMQAGSLPAGFSAHNEFGDYSMRLASTNGEISIERDFRIPAQVIPPPNYQAFADFARQIEAAEQTTIALHSDPTATARTF